MHDVINKITLKHVTINLNSSHDKYIQYSIIFITTIIKSLKMIYNIEKKKGNTL